MTNEIRPCVFNWRGDRYKGLFHCWAISMGNCLSFTEKGETVALVENKNGVMFEVHSDDVFFMDTEKQMREFDDFFENVIEEMVGDAE